jgi:hypothetical protein
MKPPYITASYARRSYAPHIAKPTPRVPARIVVPAERHTKGGQGRADDQVSGDAFCVGACIFFVAAMVCFYGAWRLLS